MSQIQAGWLDQLARYNEVIYTITQCSRIASKYHNISLIWTSPENCFKLKKYNIFETLIKKEEGEGEDPQIYH